MERIINIKGKVKYPITLDPSVWIFDDRRLDLTTHFLTEKDNTDSTEAYTKAVSKHWDREIMEGAVFPPTLKTERIYEKQKMLTGTFGILFKPFLKNSEPASTASVLVIETEDDNYELPINEAYELILGFSDKGKQLSADGPVYVYFGDGSNQQNPIKKVKGFIVK
ncbi:peptidyl-prolyl cis-trans isomerase [Neobacillus citreus]|uniref:Peptidyl-prolyl cis-trans isomerase n=1 Tax=Neobacillus citreus TaxID=2833578 RepID=A0A942SWB1_9BACI|nr:peptidyl-prolyl cis-trans isomerase [Neobacillus citreus]MCH6265748.1 peptidyl-prolyl cis-trans isomerase [Neobacillus citreus]